MNRYQKIATLPHFTLEQRMVSAVVEYDRAQERKPGHSLYALGLYLEAAGTAARDAATQPLRAAILGSFCGRLADCVLQACGEPPRNLQTQERYL